MARVKLCYTSEFVECFRHASAHGPWSDETAKRRILKMKDVLDGVFADGVPADHLTFDRASDPPHIRLGYPGSFGALFAEFSHVRPVISLPGQETLAQAEEFVCVVSSGRRGMASVAAMRLNRPDDRFLVFFAGPKNACRERVSRLRMDASVTARFVSELRELRC